MPHDLRDEVVDFVNQWSEKTELKPRCLLDWMSLSDRKFRHWRRRYGRVNEHNAQIPRDHWLESWEKEAIEEYASGHPGEGYRRLSFMMLDEEVVSVSPSSVYRVLKEAGLLGVSQARSTGKGKGFTQPLRPHEHWHVDFSYLNVSGTFYYLCAILDGCSRWIVHWEIRESMKETDAEIVLQRAREMYPEERPRIITDNGSAFVARDFKCFIRQWETEHVLTSPGHPQSNGKLERYHRSLKSEAIRKQSPLTLEDARRVVEGYVEYYNTRRLHSALGYVTPQTKLEGREKEVWAERDRKLEQAREERRQRRLMEKEART